MGVPNQDTELADEVLRLWDAADDRAVRASLVPLLQRFVVAPAVEDRMARDYLHSVRAGDRHLAAILQPGSPRVVAVYTHVVLRRLRQGRGLARYAVRHLARRGDGLGVLQGVLVSEHFGRDDVGAVVEAHAEHLSPDLRTDADVLRDAEAWGTRVLERHGAWLDGLRSLPAAVPTAPALSRPGLDAVLTQEWSGDRVRIRATPAPPGRRPRLLVTLRDDDGAIVDLFRLLPVRFEGSVAVFEVWLAGRRATAVAASVRLL